ncbi:hypothetical protein MNBD_GAMMA12-3780 [hydrothermal vent metagenome]|uniref:Lipoprotein n=1 Tax=hydrothermal vent metagenome TaxID=652676 RepID=A0A3B0YQK4_9ZZZZ
MKQQFLLVVCLGFLLSCSDSMTESSLIGVYQIKAKNGVYRDFIKIVKKDGFFFIKERSGAKWNSLGKASTAKKLELEKLIGEEIKIKFVGLSNKNLALYRMPKDWSMEKFKTSTGYWMASMIGPIELYKK